MPLMRIHQFDVNAFYWLLARRSYQYWVTVGRVISSTADGYYYPIAAIALYAFAEQGSQLALAIAVAFAVERPLYWLLKNSFKRNRPQQALPNYKPVVTPSDYFSFPSGHTSGAFLVASVIAVGFPMLSPLLFFWAAAVAFSRVIIGVHFPTDTLIGALLGMACAQFAFEMLLP